LEKLTITTTGHEANNPVKAYAMFEDDHWWFVARRRILRRMVRRLLEPSRDRLVIDVGCGSGGNLASLAAMFRCLGIDTSQTAIDLATRRFPTVQFVCGVAPRDIETDAAQADLWLLMDVLEHVEAADTLLRSLLAVAKPGALFFITVPADPALWSAHDDAAGHWRRYTTESLRQLWASLPVRERLLSGYNARLYWPVRILRGVTARLGRRYGSAHADGLDLRIPRKPFNGILTGLFTDESVRLTSALGNPQTGYRRGVSLIAVIERLPGTIEAGGEDVPISALTARELGDTH
jgi:SAM-dependent methyltransferase